MGLLELDEAHSLHASKNPIAPAPGIPKLVAGHRDTALMLPSYTAGRLGTGLSLLCMGFSLAGVQNGPKANQASTQHMRNLNILQTPIPQPPILQPRGTTLPILKTPFQLGYNKIQACADTCTLYMYMHMPICIRREILHVCIIYI